jgi:hypothetical protein
MVREDAGAAEMALADLAVPDRPAGGMTGARLEAGQTLVDGIGVGHEQLNRPGSTPGAI